MVSCGRLSLLLVGFWVEAHIEIFGGHEAEKYARCFSWPQGILVPANSLVGKAVSCTDWLGGSSLKWPIMCWLGRYAPLYLSVVPYLHKDKCPVNTLTLVAWHSGRMSVFGRRTFPVLLSTCSWRVTTYVGKLSAIGQPTRPTKPFFLSRSIN